ALPAPGGAAKSRSFFDQMNDLAVQSGLVGLMYLINADPLRGTLAKFLTDDERRALLESAGGAQGDAVFVACAAPQLLTTATGQLRQALGERWGVIEQEAFRFCWVTDYPFYEENPETGRIEFSHNPFSMPQGGLDALMTQPPLSILAHQYDIVCNGIELSSGAIRNHRPDIMLKAFEIAGHDHTEVERRFGGMLR